MHCRRACADVSQCSGSARKTSISTYVSTAVIMHRPASPPESHRSAGPASDIPLLDRRGPFGVTFSATRRPVSSLNSRTVLGRMPRRSLRAFGIVTWPRSLTLAFKAASFTYKKNAFIYLLHMYTVARATRSLVFAGAGKTVEAIDVSNPESPASLAHLEGEPIFTTPRNGCAGNAHDLVVRDGLVYVTAQPGGRIGILRFRHM